MAHTYNGAGSIGDATPSQNDFRIGGRQASAQYFQGRIDEPRIYKRSLTASEVSALASGAGGMDISWLVSDQLGTPRMVFDKSGSLASTRRHDYLPFGEELYATQGLRTATLGYSSSDAIRQKFTGYERDSETGLDYAQARYYSNTSGRFTGPDPLLASARATEPQTWNRYAYVGNSPVVFSDPSGLSRGPAGMYSSIRSLDGPPASRGNNTILEESEAEYEGKLADTLAAIKEAESINEALRKGKITEEQARDRAAKNPMLQVESQNSQHSSNSTMIVIWEVDLPSSPVGHVSQITMQDDMSYSWDMGGGSWLNQDWTKDQPSQNYTDRRSHNSAGEGFVLDFGTELNAKFQKAMLHAYDRGFLGLRRSYDPLNDNCGHAFNKAFNAIAKDLGMSRQRPIVTPAGIREFIQNDLKKYIVATKSFPKQ